MPEFKLEALPPREAIAFFRDKGYKIGFSYEDVWQQEHQSAFTVAKAMNLDVLRTIRGSVDKALAEGRTFAQFKDELEPELVRRGWWGRATMTDPLTGETELVQLGSVHRLRRIYDTNLRTAHGEGQWERVQASSDRFPYLQYDGNNSEVPRETHSAWDGLVLPKDHPFWESHFPIKEFGCKCFVRLLTRRMVEQRGLTIGPVPRVPTKTYRNKRTGEVSVVPEGVHPAFNYPIGERRDRLGTHLAQKLDRAEIDDAHAALTEMVGSSEFAEWVATPTTSLPVFRLTPEVTNALGVRSGVALMTKDVVAQQQAVRNALTVPDYQELPDLGRAPTVVVRDGDRTAIVRRQRDGRIYMAVVGSVVEGGWLSVTSFSRVTATTVAQWVRRGDVVFGRWR